MQHLSEYEREDQFLAFGGTGGLLNLDKVRAAQKVLDKISRYQQQQERQKKQRSGDALSCTSSSSSDMYVWVSILLFVYTRSPSTCVSFFFFPSSDGEPRSSSSKYCDKSEEFWDWSERSLNQQHPSTNPAGDHRVTLFDLCSSDGGLDWRTIKVNNIASSPPKHFLTLLFVAS